MKLRLFIVTMLVTLAVGIVSFAGSWTGSYETGWQYVNDDGTYVTGSWMQDSDGLWYYFGPDSIMVRDAWVEGEYYLGSTGAMLTDTITPDGYQVGSDGRWIRESSTDAYAGTEALSFDQIVEIFRMSFTQSSNEYIECTEVYGENSNTIVMTLNITSDEISGYEDVLVYMVEGLMRDSWNELADPISEQYGQKLYFRLNIDVNGTPYKTVTY